MREVDGPQGSVSSIGSLSDPGVEPEPVGLRCGDLAGSRVLEKLAKHALLPGERAVRSELEFHEDYERPGFPVRRFQIWTEGLFDLLLRLFEGGLRVACGNRDDR